MWRRIRNKSSKNSSLWNATITCKIINDNIIYYIGQHHYNDCNIINYNNINTDWKINSKIISQFKTEYFEKLKDYLKNSSGNYLSLKTFKGYSLNIFYKYRYNNCFFLLILIGYIIHI